MKESLSRKPVYVIAGLFIFVLIVAGGVVFVAKTSSTARQALFTNPLVQYFKHTYNSVKKLPDILFTPYMLAPSALSTYYLTIPLDNIVRMNDALPDDPMNGHLLEENKLSVKAQFKDPATGYDERVDIKYRGISANHWNALQKSYRVQFPSNHFWQGERLVNFVTPYDRMYYVEPLNAYRAKKLGLISLDMHFVRLNINGTDTGVYLMFEQWSPELLAKKGLPELKMFGDTDVPNSAAGVLGTYVNLFDALDTKKEELAALLALRDNADDATFKKLLPQIMDMDKLYRWDILTILSGSTHQTEATNAILFFNTALGKFELVPWDTELADVSRFPYIDTASLLIRRVMSIPEFRAERDRQLRAYLDDPAHIADDLAFYDTLAATTKADFFKDTYKFHSDLGYLSLVKQDRQWIINAYNEAKDLSSSYEYPSYTSSGTLSFSGSFARLSELTQTIDQFLAWNPQFYKVDEHTVGLSGAHTFFSDIIIPPQIALVIAPGTSLFLDADVSLFVHGPVQAEGTAFAPLSINRLNPNKAWGTFAVIDANATSTISYMNVDGGSGATHDGIIITAMFAFHGGDAVIDHSSFSHSSNDDEVNTKNAVTRITNSIFQHSYSDAIDVDFAKKGSLFAQNTFTNIGVDSNGDAMDLSWSTVTIQNNTVDICNDKGVSVGEHSQSDIEGNTFIGCTFGVAVKDSSNVSIAGNIFKKNATAIGLYQKKQTFGGGHATIGENIFSDNEIEVKPDANSTVEYVP